MRQSFQVSPEVQAAVAGGRPVVALESTVFSRLGLPGPAGAEALRRSLKGITSAGVLPAVTAVLHGVARVGLEQGDFKAVLAATRKASERDLPVAVAQRWPAAGTTVSASVALASAAGVAVFATGAIGGVHRDWVRTGDESADLTALARYPVVTVCAGAKSFLDLGQTLERLETLGVPVLGLATDEFPAFYSRHSGVAVPHRVESAAEAAEVVIAARALGYRGGILVAVPVPEADEVPLEEVEPVVQSALAEAADAGMAGPAVTPFVLERVAAQTGGRSLGANVALVEANARVAAALSAALLQMSS